MKRVFIQPRVTVVEMYPSLLVEVSSIPVEVSSIPVTGGKTGSFDARAWSGFEDEFDEYDEYDEYEEE